MENSGYEAVKVQTVVHAPVEKVWAYWTKPQHIMKWNHASEDWHTPSAENDLRAGGKFNWRMESKDGSQGFDFTGVYDEVKEPELITYTMDDGRKVRITFTPEGEETRVVEVFEAEGSNSVEMQKAGWQAILDNFRRYTEKGSRDSGLAP